MTDPEAGFPQIIITRKSGDEQFHQGGVTLNASVLDFWRWSASDLVSNATRGILAEYIVASALDLTHGVRNEWDAFDFVTPNGIKIEVKSAAYLQSWYHSQLSSIIFNIRPTRAWDAVNNTYQAERKRQADLYVFCLLNHKHKDSLDPLNLDQWQFFLLPTAVLNEKMSHQQTISLATLLKLNPLMCTYNDLAHSIEMVANVLKQ